MNSSFGDTQVPGLADLPEDLEDSNDEHLNMSILVDAARALVHVGDEAPDLGILPPDVIKVCRQSRRTFMLYIFVTYFFFIIFILFLYHYLRSAISLPFL